MYLGRQETWDGPNLQGSTGNSSGRGLLLPAIQVATLLLSIKQSRVGVCTQTGTGAWEGCNPQEHLPFFCGCSLVGDWENGHHLGHSHLQDSQWAVVPLTYPGNQERPCTPRVALPPEANPTPAAQAQAAWRGERTVFVK